MEYLTKELLRTSYQLISIEKWGNMSQETNLLKSLQNTIQMMKLVGALKCQQEQLDFQLTGSLSTHIFAFILKIHCTATLLYRIFRVTVPECLSIRHRTDHRQTISHSPLAGLKKHHWCFQACFFLYWKRSFSLLGGHHSSL